MKATVLIGFFYGLALGVVARAWMRWIAPDPEFTVGGTLGIVVGFGIFAAVQTAIYKFRQKARSKWTTNLARGFGVIFSLQLFVAAGALMFPTVLLVSLAKWRTSWNRFIRWLLALVGTSLWAIIVARILDKFGLSVASVGRITLFAAIYIVIIRCLKPTVSAVSTN